MSIILEGVVVVGAFLESDMNKKILLTHSNFVI